MIIEGVNFKFWNFIAVYIMCLKEERFRKFKSNTKWTSLYINLVNLTVKYEFYWTHDWYLHIVMSWDFDTTEFWTCMALKKSYAIYILNPGSYISSKYHMTMLINLVLIFYCSVCQIMIINFWKSPIIDFRTLLNYLKTIYDI